MKEKITYTVYNLAPESAKFYLNGKTIEIPCEYSAGYYASIGDRKQAIDRAKQYIRKAGKNILLNIPESECDCIVYV